MDKMAMTNDAGGGNHMALFVTDKHVAPTAGMRKIGKGKPKEITLGGPARAALRAATGFNNVSSRNLADFFQEAFIAKSDPAGQTAPPTLMPRRGRRSRLTGRLKFDLDKSDFRKVFCRGNH